MPTAAARRAYSGPILLSFGFRPFFFFGAVWAAFSVPLWVWMYAGGSSLGVHRDWHVHEMLFGYLAAVVAGFLTTAIPNWTGRMPVIGAPLGLLVGLWVAGRVAMLLEFAIGPAAAVIDSAFLLVFAGVVWREVLAGRNWRNLPVCSLVSILALGNVAFHLNAQFSHALLGERIGLAAILLLLSLIGGRIIPSFTANWLKARGITKRPASFGHLDRAALALTALAATGWILLPDAAATGWAMLSAGVAHLVRLVRWRGWLAAKEPLLWILHAGYAWLGVGLLLLGASRLTEVVPQTAGVHALTAGAIGVMTLAVMTRATRGHSGRALAADRSTVLVYVAILAAAALRVLAPFWPAAQIGLLAASAAFWSLAFAAYAAVYAPMLLRPRPAAA
ncbi:MAG TPA: NnrS family protein [Phenylobacterium sp.]